MRAPLGKITLGQNTNGAVTGHTNLLPGSVTSVSASGLVMPYGGSLDGLSYMMDGVDVAYKGVGNDPAVVLTGEHVDVRAGAVLDLSGGGTLTGAAFLAGRGGSTDARLNPLVQTSGKGGFVLPGLATNPVYAIVPGAQAGYAPIVAENGAGDPALGRQITIGAGVPGLAAGTYTLLPSSFALLPGAFRVELNGLAAGGLPVGSATAMRNGSFATAVQLGTSNTDRRTVLPSQAVLTPADVLRSYSQYNETSYGAFALAQAVRDGVRGRCSNATPRRCTSNWCSPRPAPTMRCALPARPTTRQARTVSAAARCCWVVLARTTKSSAAPVRPPSTSRAWRCGSTP